jgi:hypothetical protein
MGEAGVVTDAQGAFDATVHDEQALFAMALHAQLGWSAPVAVPGGRGDAEIEIRAARGGLSGSVRRSGSPVEAVVYIKSAAFLLEIETDDSGRFDVPLLAPGRYQVSAHAAQLFAGGTSAGVARDVEIAAGKPSSVTLDLPSGVLVIVTAREAAKLSTVEYYLMPGKQDGLDTAKLRELGKTGKALDYLLGGQDVDQPMQFHDVAPGDYTLCVDRHLDREHALPLVCRPVPVGGKPVLELEI